MAVTTAYALVFPAWYRAQFLLCHVAGCVDGAEQVVIIPNFLTIGDMGLIVTTSGDLSLMDYMRGWLAIVLPGASIAFGTFLLRQDFRTIPADLIDAAKVDGANHWTALMNVV